MNRREDRDDVETGPEDTLEGKGLGRVRIREPKKPSQEKVEEVLTKKRYETRTTRVSLKKFYFPWRSTLNPHRQKRLGRGKGCHQPGATSITVSLMGRETRVSNQFPIRILTGNNRLVSMGTLRGLSLRGKSTRVTEVPVFTRVDGDHRHKYW